MEFGTDLAITLSLVFYEVYAKCILILAKSFPSFARSIVNARFAEPCKIIIGGLDDTDIQLVKDHNVYGNLLAYREVGLMDAYVDGVIDIRDLLGFFVKIMERPEMQSVIHPLDWVMSWLNLNTGKRAWEVARAHYIGNDLYQAMLDKNMQYSCGYWKEAETLDEAQLAKMDLIARKLYLEPGMRVLDIGCGFGTLARHLAQNYEVSVVGCTLSKEQAKYAREICKDLDVDIRLCDYRDLDEKFDRIISIQMFQHIGAHNYRQFMQVGHRCLTDDGLFQLHVIGVSATQSPRFKLWFHKMVCPNLQLPYSLDIVKAIEGLWVIEDWHSTGWHFADTFAAWLQNFEDSWPKLSENHDERFHRMWKIYLTYAQAAFMTRMYDYWHIVLSKNVRKQRYSSVR